MKRLYRYLILLIVIIAMGVVLALRWNAWFSNSLELPYTSPNQFERITLAPTATFGDSITLSWRFGEELQERALVHYALIDSSTATVWQQATAQGEVVYSRAGKGCYYTTTIATPAKGSSYRYLLQVGDHHSDTLGFKTASGLDQKMRFVYIGDVQDPSGELSQSMFGHLNSLLEGALNPIDFVAFAGDQIESTTDTHWGIWYEGLQGLSTRYPMIVATGNHEYLKKGFGRELDSRFVPQHHFPSTSPKGFEGRSYYIDFPLLRLIVIDTNGIRTPLAITRHRSWLRSALQDSTQPWQVVMMHHAVHAVRAGRSNPVEKYLLDPILRKHGADLVLQGHDHAYSRISSRTADNALTTPVYIISCSSPKLYPNGFEPVHDRLGSGIQLYQCIEVTPDSISYHSYQYDDTFYDALVVRRTEDGNEVIDQATKVPELLLFDDFGSSKKGEKRAEKYQRERDKRLREKR